MGASGRMVDRMRALDSHEFSISTREPFANRRGQQYVDITESGEHIAGTIRSDRDQLQR
jgi:hypothetical protein